MNNIAGFIQPSIFPQPNVVSIMPSSVPMVSAGGRSDILTIAVVSTVVVIVLFMIYKNMSFGSNSLIDDDVEEFKQKENVDPLTKCGWEVIISPTCPWCVKQKQILDQHFPTFKNIYTDKPADAVPLWVNKNGNKIPGFQTYEKLMSMANC